MSSPYASLRREALEANREIARLELAILTWGNASAFDAQKGVLAIKPSGLPYGDLDEESMVVLDLEGQVVEGSLRPSSDVKTHLELYRAFGKIGGVCHSHSPHAVAWAQARHPIPCFGTTHADETAGPVPCTPMISVEALATDYERATGQLIIETLAGRDPLEAPMILVAGHGPFAWGESALKAVHCAAALEEVARMAILTLEIDPAVGLLPGHVVRKHWERKHGPGARYGQR
jgi:L-ribulose-5-phosphate 4-epimerase